MLFFRKPKFLSGALPDNRPLAEKEKDFKFEEIVTEPEPVNWVEKKEFRRFPIFDQNSSGTCVSASLAKILGIMHQVNEGEWINFSAGYIYQQRKNKPSSGMYAVDAWEIVRKTGCLLEEFFPWQNKKDEEIDNYQVKPYERKIAEVFRIGGYVELPLKDIDVVASTIQKTGKGVMVWFYFTINEWNREVPVIQYNNLAILTASKHSVVAVDYTLYNGKKAIIIEDSWGVNTGKQGQRIITEDFYKERNFYCAYPINFKYQEGITDRPVWKFEKNLYYGVRGDPDVKMLQKCLKYLGFFPINIDETGNYLEITRRAVLEFQLNYNIMNLIEINKNLGKIVEEKTRAKLNEIFAY